MAIASDNKFPKVYLTTQASNPSAPSGSDWKLFAKADGVYAMGSNATPVGPFGAGGGSFDPDEHMPWHIDIDVFATAATNTNWDTITLASAAGINALYYAIKDSSAAQNDEIGWDVILAAGTWSIELIHRAWSDRGIYSIRLDGVEQGTIDGYTAGDNPNTRSSVTGISVATTGKKRLLLKMATKNGSSSNYRGSIQHVRLLRTA